MNLHRVSKKTPHVDYRQTLNALHEQKLQEFADQRAKLPDKEKLLGQLIAQYNSDDPNINRYDLYDRVGKLQKHVKKLRNNDYENEYLIKAAPYLLKYSEENNKFKNRLTNDSKSVLCNSDNECSDNEGVEGRKIKNISDFIKQEDINNKGQISKEFEHVCISNLNCKIQKSLYEQEQEALICKCGGKRVPMPREAVASCTTCGHQVEYVDNQGPIEYRPEVEILSPFAYKRINHFKEWLSQMQALETTTPSDELIDKLLIELKKDRIKDVTKITNQRIKGYLKKLRYTKQYEHIPAIINKLCGIPPPVITRELQNKLINMFQEAQAPFEKCCPKGRKNFLSYSYTLHKMCQLLGEDQLLPCFPLLKSREKLYLQDSMWKDICNELSWEFVSSL